MSNEQPTINYPKQIENKNLEKRKDKKILENLEFLIKEDENSETETFYSKRHLEVRKKIQNSIVELKKMSFERAVDNTIKTRIAAKLLVEVEYLTEISEKLLNRAEENESKIEKRADDYGVDYTKKVVEFSENNHREIDDLNKEIAKQEEKVKRLQELVVLDDEFKAEYLKSLDYESGLYQLKTKEKDQFIIKETLKLLEDIPFAEKTIKELKEIDVLINTLQSEEEEIPSVELDWEILPPGEAPESLRAPRDPNRIDVGEWERSMRDEDRINFLMELKPKKIYSSSFSGESREFSAYVFDNYTVVASPWTKNAMYVIPSAENNEEMLREKKRGLQAKGAVMVLAVSGWKERLKQILDSPVEVNFLMGIDQDVNDFNGTNYENITREELAEIMREKVFRIDPEIQKYIEDGDEVGAIEKISKLEYKDFSSAIIRIVIKNCEKLCYCLIDAFPEINLKEDHFKTKKFRWKNISEEMKIENIRKAIIDEIPDVEASIKEGNIEEAEEWILTLYNPKDLASIGLSTLVQGGVAGLNPKEGIIKAFPELVNLAEKINSIKETKPRGRDWLMEFRNLLSMRIEGLESDLKKGKTEIAKMKMIKYLKEQGVTKFIDENIKGIRVAGRNSGIGESTPDFLRHAFPEIDWADISFMGGRRKKEKK
jgi:hypothetical protein